MRVMMIGPYPQSPHQIDGGVAAAMTYLSQALVKTPEFELIGVRIGGGSDRFREVQQFDWPVRDLPLGRFGLTTLYRDQLVQLRRLIRQFRPDIVHAQGVDVEGYLAVKSGVPSVITVHGVLGESAKFKTGAVGVTRAALSAMLTERPTVRRARDMISISPYIANYYRSEIRGRVHDIPNAVGDSFFRVTRVPETGRALFAGRISKGKGVLELVRAVARSPVHPRKVVLAGSCPDVAYANQVNLEIARLGVKERVHLVGLLSEAALLEEFERAEYLVLPSFQETAPMVIQQAMASGLAVVASRVGGVPFQIDDGVTGLLTDPGNVDQLADAFGTIGANPQLCENLGSRAKAFAVSRFAAHVVADATLHVYEASVGMSGGRSQ